MKKTQKTQETKEQSVKAAKKSDVQKVRTAEGYRRELLKRMKMAKS